MTDGGRDHLVLVGSGSRPYREYAFRTLAGRYRLSAVLSSPPTWQAPYLDRAVVADLNDPDAVATAVASLWASERPGVLTWDETLVVTTALAAAQLGLPHMSPAAAGACRDKHTTRSTMAQLEDGSVQHALVHTLAQALPAARAIGYPVVLKPRALAGSVGVSRADDPAELRRLFPVARDSRFSTLPAGHGILVEEYLDGPEISVDSVVVDGSVHCVHVARKRLGFAPFFEEVGHLVTEWGHEPWADGVARLVAGAHSALGVDLGVTHAEVRLTPRGPRLVELNGRLGGDLIPLAGEMATGVDLVAAAAELALGREPDLRHRRRRSAEVRFVYPPHDCRVLDLDVEHASRIDGIAAALPLARFGDELRLPPATAIPRLAALVAVGDDPADCGRVLDEATGAVVTELAALPRDISTAPVPPTDRPDHEVTTRSCPTRRSSTGSPTT